MQFLEKKTLEEEGKEEGSRYTMLAYILIALDSRL
jgi:hypothetical protein